MKIPLKFSIGFASGLFAVQSRTGFLFSLNYSFVDFAVWGGTRSCWKMNELSSMYGIRKWSKTSWLTAVLIGLFKKQIFLTPVANVIPNHYSLREFYAFFFSLYLAYLSYDFLQMLRPWSPKEVQNLDSSLKITQFHWSTNHFMISNPYWMLLFLFKC